VGGIFPTAGGVAVNNIAGWTGSSWSAVGGGVSGPPYPNPTPSVRSLTVHDDGNGPALYAGGIFTTADFANANNIAKWDGASWSALGSGVSGGDVPAVYSLTGHGEGAESALYAGGRFTNLPDGHLARWGHLDTEPPTISCPPPIYAPDRNLDDQEVVYFAPAATDDFDPAPAIVCTPPSGSTFPLGTTQVVCTATDACGNQSTCQFEVTVAHKVRRR